MTDLNNLYVKFHQEAEKNPALEDEAGMVQETRSREFWGKGTLAALQGH